jgi:hypothetical protein
MNQAFVINDLFNNNKKLRFPQSDQLYFEFQYERCQVWGIKVNHIMWWGEGPQVFPCGLIKTLKAPNPSLALDSF